MIAVRRLPDPHTAKDRNALPVKSNLGWILVLTMAAAAGLSARPAAAQVGFSPDRSPYHYIEGNKTLGLRAGYLWGDLGTPGVGPANGLVTAARFDYRLGTAVGFTANVGVMSLKRTVLDPDTTLDARNLGQFTQGVAFADIGLLLLLTGRKTWRGFAPYAGASVGLAIGRPVDAEDGGFSFSTKFLLSPTAGMRYHVSDRLSLNFEMRDMVWRLGYPPSYFEPRDDGTPPILNPSSDSSKEWTHHFVLTLGMGYAFGF
jgi:hypothetical protein